MELTVLPRHVAIIMDGNGRWAVSKGYPRFYGHVRGAARVKEVVRTSRELGIRALTLYAFSTENWKRPEEELQVLWKILRKYLRREVRELKSQGIRLNVIGEIERLPPEAGRELREAIETLSTGREMDLTFALSYGSRTELVSVAQVLARDVLAGRLEPEAINEREFERHLWTSVLGERTRRVFEVPGGLCGSQKEVRSLMSRNLKQRVLTALVGLPLVLFLLLGWGLNGVAILCFVISMGMLYEFCRMIFRLGDARKKTLLALGAAAFVHAFNFVLPTGLSLGFLGTFPVLVFFTMFLFMVPRLFQYAGKEVLETESGARMLQTHVQELMALCFAMVYCVSFPLFMIGIREFTLGQHWLVLTLVVIWASDTFAYFAGLSLGRHRLFDLVSPKKTWEGAVGGTLGAMGVAVLYAHFFLPRESTLFIGFLDRFDGVVFALPVMFFILRIFSYGAGI
ncbi:di-trans,poly-cis-decaprenylcistransferase [bacterium]|nr:di-trans,poly-cis-decaprenylcistransferase [bacterium]